MRSPCIPQHRRNRDHWVIGLTRRRFTQAFLPPQAVASPNLLEERTKCGLDDRLICSNPVLSLILRESPFFHKWCSGFPRHWTSAAQVPPPYPMTARSPPTLLGARGDQPSKRIKSTGTFLFQIAVTILPLTPLNILNKTQKHGFNRPKHHGTDNQTKAHQKR